jgi:hypothetical protein
MKKITSLSLGFSFLIMSYTGVILYIAPHGRISRWLDWHLFGLDKIQYQELHITSMVTFLLFALLHIYYNWKPIISYMRDTSSKISFTKKEFLIAFSLNALFVIGTLTLVQPFKGFLDLGENIKDSWGQKTTKAPPQQLGRKTLQELSATGNIDLEKSIEILKLEGLTNINSSYKIREIANELDTTPTNIYTILTE